MVGLRNKHAAEEAKALREDGAAAQTTNTPKSISRIQTLYLTYWMCLGEAEGVDVCVCACETERERGRFDCTLVTTKVWLVSIFRCCRLSLSLSLLQPGSVSLKIQQRAVLPASSRSFLPFILNKMKKMKVCE